MSIVVAVLGGWLAAVASWVALAVVARSLGLIRDRRAEADEVRRAGEARLAGLEAAVAELARRQEAVAGGASGGRVHVPPAGMGELMDYQPEGLAPEDIPR